MGKGFGKGDNISQTKLKTKFTKAKLGKLQIKFMSLMGKDNRKAAEFLVKYDLYLPARKTVDIDWYSVDEVEQWLDNEELIIQDAVDTVKIQLGATDG